MLPAHTVDISAIVSKTYKVHYSAKSQRMEEKGKQNNICLADFSTNFTVPADITFIQEKSDIGIQRM
jgi:hypothetical protein